MTVLIDTGPVEGMPEFDETIRCKEHPDARVETGFGLAGGGYGPYTLCPICARVLSKSQED